VHVSAATTVITAPPVIPAKAGTQSRRKMWRVALGPRFRGDDEQGGDDE